MHYSTLNTLRRTAGLQVRHSPMLFVNAEGRGKSMHCQLCVCAKGLQQSGVGDGAHGLVVAETRSDRLRRAKRGAPEAGW